MISPRLIADTKNTRTHHEGVVDVTATPVASAISVRLKINHSDPTARQSRQASNEMLRNAARSPDAKGVSS